MKFLWSVLSLISITLCQGQYNPVGAITMWTDGYVVTLKNDTIRGRIRVGMLVNDSPATVIIRHTDQTKTKLKSDDLRLIAQRIPDFAYSTGSIPQTRTFVVFERVPNPRRNNKLTLLERLTPFGGKIALYFDASGWKKTTEYTFGNFVFETNHEEMSYIALKNGTEVLIAKRGNLEVIHDQVFGDCPAFIHNYPTATRRDWKQFGDMVYAYNQLCEAEQ
ncbi:hypothetical protein WBJ53_19695 [Spirosoma sp. SC4-14]|uniref:hypothetical protein n=1 Tax=Spirosoma sp. SC4-14 TaxID=3128900 RepID=UPI0030CBE1E3